MAIVIWFSSVVRQELIDICVPTLPYFKYFKVVIGHFSDLCCRCRDTFRIPSSSFWQYYYLQTAQIHINTHHSILR